MPFYCDDQYYRTRPLYGYAALAGFSGGLNPYYPFYLAFSTRYPVGGPVPIPGGFAWPAYGWVNYGL